MASNYMIEWLCEGCAAPSAPRCPSGAAGTGTPPAPRDKLPVGNTLLLSGTMDTDSLLLKQF